MSPCSETGSHVWTAPRRVAVCCCRALLLSGPARGICIVMENSLNFHKPLPASSSGSNVGMIVCRRLFFFGCADLAAGEQQHGGWRFPSLASNVVPAVVVTDGERKSRRLYAAPICSSRVPVRSGDSELEDLPYPATIIATIEDRAEMGSGGSGRENLYCNAPGKSGPRRKPDLASAPG